MAVLDLLTKMIKMIETEWLDAFEVQARPIRITCS